MTEPWVLPLAILVAFPVGFAIGYRHPFSRRHPSLKSRPRADPIGGSDLTTNRSGEARLVGDSRGSAQNNIVMEFLGDYVYAAATNDYAVAVWNDTREAAVCGPVQTWRAAMQADPSTFPVGRPAIQQACPATFGNTDIFAWSGLDPTP